MDTRTGQIYESFEAAREAGVPEEFIAPVPRHAVDVQRECYNTRDMGRSKLQPHQVMECRRAFYAGAEAFFRCVFDVSGNDVSEDAGAEYLETLSQELQAFGRDVGAGKA